MIDLSAFCAGEYEYLGPLDWLRRPFAFDAAGRHWRAASNGRATLIVEGDAGDLPFLPDDALKALLGAANRRVWAPANSDVASVLDACRQSAANCQCRGAGQIECACCGRPGAPCGCPGCAVRCGAVLIGAALTRRYIAPFSGPCRVIVRGATDAVGFVTEGWGVTIAPLKLRPGWLSDLTVVDLALKAADDARVGPGDGDAAEASQ